MDLFMPAERVLYDRAYYLSDEAERDYAFEVAEEHGIDVGEVLYSDELMKEVRDALDRDIDLYLDDEIANFDSMLRELKRGENPEHPAEISVVAMGSVGRWDGPSRGLVAANSLRDLIDGKGSADALVDCRIDRLVDTNGTFSIEASHHDGTAYLDVRLISGVSFDGKGFRLGAEQLHDVVIAVDLEVIGRDCAVACIHIGHIRHLQGNGCPHRCYPPVTHTRTPLPEREGASYARP